MNKINKKYEEWCEKIAKTIDTKDLISHFRKHTHNHFKRHNNSETEISLKNWMTSVFCFMEIFEKKFPNITADDKLYKLCKYYKKHKYSKKDGKEGPKADLDIDKFMKDYKGDII